MASIFESRPRINGEDGYDPSPRGRFLSLHWDELSKLCDEFFVMKRKTGRVSDAPKFCKDYLSLPAFDGIPEKKISYDNECIGAFQDFIDAVRGKIYG
jgi:hypothetical protein